jgi:Flp pilus assembly protein TadD
MLGAADERKLAEHVLGPAIAARLPEAMQILTAVLQGRKDSRYTEARTTLETVRQWGADQFGILAALADLLVLEGRHEEGLHLWADAVAKYKDWPQSWLSYGIQLLRADRAKEAVTAFQEGRRLAPDETVLRFVLACALARAGETQQAQALFDEVVQTHATAARAWMESDPVLERALRSVPNSPNYLRVMNIPPESE